MIVNENLLIQFLSKWLADYAKQNGRTTFVIVDNSSRQSCLAKLICSEATKIIGGLKVRVCNTNHLEAHKIAEEINGIVIGLVDRTYGLYHRSFSKLDEGLGDIFPLFDLEYSEIVQITEKVLLDQNFTDPVEYRLIEFCNKANALYSIITEDQPPHKNKRWPYFLTEQKKWLAIVHQREKSTRHKAITKPYPKIPEILCKRSEL